MTPTRAVSLEFATIRALAGCGQVSAHIPEPGALDGLSGVWLLDPEASDHVDSVMAASEGPRRGDTAMRPGGGDRRGQAPAGGRMIVRSEALAIIGSLAEFPERLVVTSRIGGGIGTEVNLTRYYELHPES